MSEDDGRCRLSCGGSALKCSCGRMFLRRQALATHSTQCHVDDVDEHAADD